MSDISQLSFDDALRTQDEDFDTSSATPPPAQPNSLRRRLSRSDLMASSRSLLISTKKQSSYRSLSECDAPSPSETDIDLFARLGDLTMPLPVSSSANVYDVTPPRRSLVRDSQRPAVRIVVRRRRGADLRSGPPSVADSPADPPSARVRHPTPAARQRSQKDVDHRDEQNLCGGQAVKEAVGYPLSVQSEPPKRPSARYRVRAVRGRAGAADAAPDDRRRRLRELLEDGDAADRLRRDLLAAQAAAAAAADSDADDSQTHVLRNAAACDETMY
jgi:hypothetical protein